MTDKRYTTLLGATVVAIPALAAANVYVQMNVPLQPPLFSRTVHPASPSGDHGSRQEDRSRRRREPVPAARRRRIRKSSASMSRTGAGSTTGTASSATATTCPATACSCTGSTRSRPTSADRGRSRCLRDTFLFWRISKGGPGLPEEGGPWDTAMPAWEKFLKEDEMWEVILFLYDFTGQKPRAREEATAMTSRSDRAARACCIRGSRCPDRLAVRRADGIGARAGSRRRDRGAAGVGQDALPQVLRAVPRREGGRRRLRHAAPAARGPATSRRASSRSARLRTERSRRIRTSSTSSGAACPTRRCRPGPTSPTRKCRISPTSSRPSPPTSRTPRTCPSPCRSRARRAATNESIELGKKLYEETGCVKCHGTLGRGDGPSAPTLKDDWGYPIRAANLAQSWTFRGGSSREDIFRTMSTGLNGTPMPSFLDALHARATMGDHRLHRLALGEQRAWLYQPRRRQARRRIRSIWRRGPRASRPLRVARFPIIGQIMEPGRAFHPPATSVTVQAIYDAESIALLVRWHDMSAQKTGRTGRRFPCRRRRRRSQRPAQPRLRRRSKGSVFGDEEVAPAPAGQPPQDPFAEAAAAPADQPSEFSDAVAIQIPSQVPTGARKPYFIFGDAQNSVDLWFFDLARPDPLQFTGKGSADIAPNDTGDLTGVASYDQGEWSVIFKRPLRRNLGRPVLARSSSCRSPSRSGTGSRASVATGEVSRSGTPSTSSQKSSHRPSARW